MSNSNGSHETLVLELRYPTYLWITIEDVEESNALSRTGFVTKKALVVRTWQKKAARRRAWDLGTDLARERMAEIAILLRSDFLERQHHITRGWEPPSRGELDVR